jgi:pimeloyl-ACP methyl ester carboxylesterase
MPVVPLKGTRFHVQLLGQGSPVVLLHGLAIGNLATWYFTAAPTLSQRHRILLYDLRGHGKSQRTPTGFDLATQVDDLADLIDAHLSPPVALVGHSYGGLVALRYAADHPDRVSRLALVDVPASPRTIAAGLREVAGDPEDLLAGLPPALRDALAQSRRRGRQLLRTVQYLVHESSLLADLAAEPDVDPALLAPISCPVLCLYGDQSYYRSDADLFMACLQRARLEILPGQHHLPIESPRRVTERLLQFLTTSVV